jgi:hypothetical protein
MITNPNIAKYVSELMLDIHNRLDESVARVNETCSPEEDAIYRRAVGRILGRILLEVLNPLYAAHPSLKPEGME